MNQEVSEWEIRLALECARWTSAARMNSLAQFGSRHGCSFGDRYRTQALSFRRRPRELPVGRWAST